MANEKKKVVDPILKVFKSYGGKAFKTDGNYKPDIVGCCLGHFFAIECKEKGLLKDVTEGQQIELDAWKKAGAIALAVDDANDIIEIMEELRKTYGNR